NLYDRALDIKPNDPELMALKASIYQAQGKLQEAARFLSGINEEIPNENTFQIKIDQLRLERNYREAVRLLQARLVQFHFASDLDKARTHGALAYMQRLAGDTAEAKVTVGMARNTLEQRYRDKPDDPYFALDLSQVYALMGEKDLALKLAQRATMLLPRAKDPAGELRFEENLAEIQTMVGENHSAISALTELLQTTYESRVYALVITPALLRLDPVWDPLRADPAFQKLCEEKQP